MYIIFFSKIGLVDQSKSCTQMYLQEFKLRKFATTNILEKKEDYFRHASSCNVHVYEFSAKSG